jgi:hypothetical protein
MPLTYTYPTDLELRLIEPELQDQLVLADPIFKFFPIVNDDADVLAWEQRDNYRGMQKVRGLNGEPGRVKSVGGKRFIMEPGYYGEVISIDEQELTRRRPYGQFSGPISIDDLVAQRNRQLAHRENVLIRYIIWTLLTTGQFAVLADDGQVKHTDAYDFQTYTAGTAWSVAATATPLANFQAVQALGAAHGANFGAGAVAFMRRSVFNEMTSNTNANDLAGKRTSGLATVIGVDDVNKVMAQSDLPTIIVYDEGYEDDDKAFQHFLPADTVVVIGKRATGESIGEYRKTRNVNNPNGEPGGYQKVVDSATPGNPNPVPRKIDVHRGHNGGPVIFYPSNVVVMSV